MKHYKEKRTLKILVAGHVGAGKTTFVTSVSRIPSLRTEAKLSRPQEKNQGHTTTVAFDFGEVYEGCKVAIFGIPGQKRFSFMWETLVKGTLGYIFMFDSTTPEMWKETLEQVEFFIDLNPAPFIFVANKQDLPGAAKPEDIRSELKVPEEIPIIPCIAIDSESARKTLLHLIDHLKKFCEEGGR